MDDESNILRTFRHCLEDAGYRVAPAADVPYAGELQRNAFDLQLAGLAPRRDFGPGPIGGDAPVRTVDDGDQRHRTFVD